VHSHKKNRQRKNIIQFSSVQPLITPVGWGHLLRCFWYQLAEMDGLAHLGPSGALETARVTSTSDEKIIIILMRIMLRTACNEQ